MKEKKSYYKLNSKLINYLTILIISFFFFMFNFAGNAWAADVYIDPSCKYSGNGTFNSGICASTKGQPGPYNTWGNVTILDSNDYRQKCGTSFKGSLTVNASGTSDNYIIVGAYYDDGGAVHEDDAPSFGQLCGNSAQKPILRQTVNGTGAIADTANGGSQYLEFNSIQFQTAEVGIYVQSNYNKVRYCYFYDIEWGLRVGTPNSGSVDGDKNTIEYNYFDLNDAVDETHPDGDCIAIYRRGQDNTVQYNVCGGFDHGGINLFGTDRNIIQYNYFFDGAIGAEDFCIGHNVNADKNIIRYNFCEDAGQGHEIMGGNNNEIYGNIYTCNGLSHPSDSQGCIQLQSSGYNGYTSSNNKIYNNTVYDNDNHSKTGSIWFMSNPGNTSEVSGNEFYNNLLLKSQQYCIRVYDPAGVIGVNHFENNSCYDYATNRYANIEDSISTNAIAFSAKAYAANNRDNDPGLKNPSAGQFWPEDVSADVVGNGYNLGLKFNKILDPVATNFKASPPIVKTQVQPADWYIGAYALSIQKKPGKPEPEKMSNWRIKSKDEENAN